MKTYMDPEMNVVNVNFEVITDSDITPELSQDIDFG